MRSRITQLLFITKPVVTGGRRIASTVIVCAMLSACTGMDSSHSDIQLYVDDVIARQNIHVEPLPEFKPYPVFIYEGGDRRDPFRASVSVEDQQIEIVGDGGIRPPKRDIKEPLEEYPLDSLRMVGTFEQFSTMWALVKSVEGSIHRVKVGNYIGKNYGKILLIDENKIEILEIIPNGSGAYIERPATIALSE